MGSFNWNKYTYLIKPNEVPSKERVVFSVEQFYYTPNPFFKSVIGDMITQGIYTSAMVVSGGYTNDILNEMHNSTDLSGSMGLFYTHSVRTYKDRNDKKGGVFIDVLVDSLTYGIYNVYKSTNLTTTHPLFELSDGSSLIGYLDGTRETTVNSELKKFKNRAIKISSGSEMIDLDQGERYYLIENDIVLPNVELCYSVLHITNINKDNSIVLSTYGNQTINEVTTVTLAKNYSTIKLISDGTNWIRV
jgi:hypothetical protein